MAERAQPVRASGTTPWPAALAWALGIFILLPLLAVAWQAGGVALRPADLAALKFTLIQAALSALISVALAVPVARALARRQFRGRLALIALMGAPFILPSLVAVLGLLAVFGRSGWLSQAVQALGFGPISVYGLTGVVLVHVFLNLPLATRMILQGWQAIPAERFRLAESLGFGPRAMWRHLEWPLLKAVLPGAVMVIFIICLTSFAVVLMLGGGPKATTIELAIYQALRFDFDLGRAAGLAALQFLLCGVVALIGRKVMQPLAFGAGSGQSGWGVSLWTRAPKGWRLWADAAAITLAAGFLLLPLGAVVWRGLAGIADLPAMVWAAAGRSVAVALVSSLVTMLAALTLADAVARAGHRSRKAMVYDLVALLPLASSGLVLGTGLFLLVQPWVNPASLALPVTVAVNAALSLPFAYRLLLPDAQAVQADYGRLAESLGLRGFGRLRHLLLPRLARPLGFGAGLSAALSMGDLGVIALFATESGATLPLVVQRLMGAYKMETASAAALLLITLSFGLFFAFDQWGRRHASP